MMNLKPQPRFRAKPEILIPSVVVGFGFEDESYGNDACAQAVLKLPYGSSEHLQLWVDYEVPAHREISTSSRFNLYYARGYEVDAVPLIQTEREGEVAACILSLLVIFNCKRVCDPWVRHGRNLWLSEKMLRMARLARNLDAFNRDNYHCALKMQRRFEP